MRRLILILNLSIVLASLKLQAQVNLAPNPSFELSTACPTIGGMLSLSDWSSFRASPDYFNVCATNFGAPNNAFGHQQPATGNAYCGFVNIWSGNNYREYLGAKLIQPLIVGQKYFLSMKVSLAERWWYFEDTLPVPLYIPSNKVGMKFTGTTFSEYNGFAATNQAALYAVNIITDTTNWTKLTGNFVADSAYKYVVLGNFFTNANTDTIGRPYILDSYFFVDDIVVTTDSTLLLAGVSALSNNANSGTSLVMSGSGINITNNNTKEKELLIYDLLGNLVHKEVFSEGQSHIDLNLKSGIYVVAVYSEGVCVCRKKALIEGSD